MIDYSHEADVFAARLRTTFDSLIRQGFTEDQAIKLLAAFMSSSCDHE